MPDKSLFTAVLTAALYFTATIFSSCIISHRTLVLTREFRIPLRKGKARLSTTINRTWNTLNYFLSFVSNIFSFFKKNKVSPWYYQACCMCMHVDGSPISTFESREWFYTLYECCAIWGYPTNLAIFKFLQSLVTTNHMHKIVGLE